MIYFDNAATGGTKPPAVINAVKAALTLCANPGRSGHKLSVACAEIVNNCRSAVCSLLGGYSPERTIFVKNCTEALNTAIFGIFKKGDHVVSSAMEHNSVLRPLKKLADDGIISYSLAPLEEGNVSAEKIASLVKENTRAVIITLCSNVTGASPDIKKIRAAIGDEILLICDGAQACGHTPINMKDEKIDVLAAAGHKGLCAIQGSGVLLFSERCDVSPLSFGGTGSESLSLDQPAFYPDRLESGTLSFPAIASLFEGALYLKGNLEKNRKILTNMCGYLLDEMRKINKIKLYSRLNEGGIIAFSCANKPSEEVAAELSDNFSICVRGGFHCAPLMHKALGTDEDGLVRVSLSAFNRPDECERFISALKKITAAK